MYKYSFIYKKGAKPKFIRTFDIGKSVGNAVVGGYNVLVGTYKIQLIHDISYLKDIINHNDDTNRVLSLVKRLVYRDFESSEIDSSRLGLMRNQILVAPLTMIIQNHDVSWKENANLYLNSTKKKLMIGTGINALITGLIGRNVYQTYKTNKKLKVLLTK